jgi:hypothetical protein
MTDTDDDRMEQAKTVIAGIEKLSAEDQETLRRLNALVARDMVLATLDIEGRPFRGVHAVSVGVNVGAIGKIILWLDTVAVKEPETEA